jgi:hypothetical protein
MVVWKGQVVMVEDFEVILLSASSTTEPQSLEVGTRRFQTRRGTLNLLCNSLVFGGLPIASFNAFDLKSRSSNI